MRVGILLLLIAGCGSTEPPNAAPGEPIGQTRPGASPLAPAPSATAVATAIEADCEPCRATDPLCTCFNGRMDVSRPPQSPSASATADVAPAAPLAIVPFRIVTKRERLSFAIEVDPSGQLALASVEKGGGSRAMGKIEGAAIFNPAGVRVAQLAADGTLAITDDEVLRLDPSNEVITSSGGRVRISNDGAIHATGPDGQPIPGFSARVEGFKPEMRRTAIVVFVSFFGVR
jgi:hypothetical protein